MRVISLGHKTGVCVLLAE